MELETLMPNSHDDVGPLFPAVQPAREPPPEPDPKPKRKPRQKREEDWVYEPVHWFALNDPVPPDHLRTREVAAEIGVNEGCVWTAVVTKGRGQYWRRGKKQILFLKPQVFAFIDAMRARRKKPPLFSHLDLPPLIEPWRQKLEKPPVTEPEPDPAPQPAPVAQAEPEPDPAPEPPPPLPAAASATPPTCHTLEEISAEWRIRIEALHAAVESGDLPAYQLCGEIRVATADYERWLKRHHTAEQPS
jgi:hypothetical protein